MRGINPKRKPDMENKVILQQQQKILTTLDCNVSYEFLIDTSLYH